MLPVRILATASRLPGPPICTAALLEAARGAPDLPEATRRSLGRSVTEIEDRSGVRSRHHFRPGDSATALGAQVLDEALARAGLAPADLRRLLLVTSTGGDQLIPANANAVLARLGVPDSCDGMDVNNACTGFLSALDLGARSVATGRGPVAIVVVENLSRHLSPRLPRPYLVLGDAAACAVLDAGRAGEGFLGSVLGNDGAAGGNVFLAHPSGTGERTFIEFRDSSQEMTELALRLLSRCIGGALSEAGCRMGDMDWVVPHQPNGAMLESFVRALEVPPERLCPVVAEVGSIGAASIAVGLDRLLSTRPVRPGHRILLCGIGAGLSFGAIVHRVGPAPTLP